MATVNTLKTRMALRYDTLANWTTSNPVLLKGELAIVDLGSTPATTGVKGDVNNAPIVAIKVGDGQTAFNSLKFTQSIAGDVSSFIKTIVSEEKFNELVDARITNAQLATADELAAAVARIGANETAISGLKAIVETGDDANSKLRASITANAATAKTQAETAETNAKEYADERASAAQSAAEATAAADATSKVNALKNGEVKNNADAITAINSKIGTTDIGEDATVTSAIKALQDSIGTSGGNSLGSRVEALEGEMDTAQENITDLRGRMATAEGEIDTLQSITAGYTGANAIQTAVAEAKKAGTDAADAVAAEKSRAEGVETDHETRIAQMETFWAAVETPDETIDTLAEIVAYIESDKSGASAMSASIAQNTAAIEKLNGTGEGSVDKKVSDAVATEKSRAEDAEAAIAADIADIKDRYITYVDAVDLKDEVIGQQDDTHVFYTIHGTRAYADLVAGTAQQNSVGFSTDDATKITVYGARKYAEEKASAAETAAKTYADGKVAEINDDISSVEAIAKAAATSTGSGLVSEVSKNTENGAISITKRAVKNADMDTNDVFVFYCGNAEGYDASFTTVDI